MNISIEDCIKNYEEHGTVLIINDGKIIEMTEEMQNE